ncbi:NUDIX domain-containing protein [Vibrio breoganii]
MFEEKKLSCGLLILDVEGRVLLQHVSQHNHWDIPKGTQKPGVPETPRETMNREVFEEIGIDFSPYQLVEIGWLPYNTYKDLWLFMCTVDESFNLSRLCSQKDKFDNNGFELNLSERHEFVPVEELGDFVCGSLKRLVESELGDIILREHQMLIDGRTQPIRLFN